MKLLESNLEELQRSSPAKMSKRFVCCVIDMIILIFITALVFSGIFKITENTSAYKEQTKIVNTEVDYYNKFISETHVVEFENNQRLSSEILAYKNLSKAIYLSYTILGTNNISDYVININDEITRNGVASLENDNISYFYTKYLPKNDTQGKIIDMYGQDPQDYLFRVYKDAFQDEASFMFIFDKNISEIPILKVDVAYCLYDYYINNDDSTSVGAKGYEYYQIFCSGYIDMLDFAIDKMIASEPYHTEHYLVYRESICNQARYTNISLLISLFIAYLLVILLPKYLFKNEKTIGYKLFGLGVIRLDGEENKWYIPLIKGIFGSIGFIVSVIIIYLFPPFNGVYDAMYYPFTIDSKLSLLWIILIVGVIGSIVNIAGLFTHYRQTFINMLFQDKVVDIHYLDEGDQDDKFEGRSY